nr:MAG TPA: hypothetical protein [Caudoviricetes sp.]
MAFSAYIYITVIERQSSIVVLIFSRSEAV